MYLLGHFLEDLINQAPFSTLYEEFFLFMALPRPSGTRVSMIMGILIFLLSGNVSSVSLLDMMFTDGFWKMSFVNLRKFSSVLGIFNWVLNFMEAFFGVIS